MRVLVLLLAVLLVGCGGASSPSQVTDNLTYIQDSKTGLCFTVLRFTGYNTSGLSIANVPCDAKVLGQIK